jgi:phosphate-selective porin OprO/OprP
MGLEDQGSTNGMLFLERPGSSDVARGIAAGDTRTGVALFGNGDRWFGSIALTGRTIGVVSTGTVLAIGSTPSTAALGTAQTFGDQAGVVGRVDFLPVRTADTIVLVGAHGTDVLRPANASGPAANGTTAGSSYVVRLRDTPELRVDGTQFVDTGNIMARHISDWGLEFAAQKQNFFLQSEYENFHIDRSDGVASPNFHAWYVEGSWLLTGEARKYNAGTAAFDAPPVAHPVKLKGGGWGAWELALRYSDLDLNYNAGILGRAPAASAIRGGDQQIWAGGVNWYFNPVFRMMFDVERVHIDRLSPNATNFLTPTGAQIGQDFTAFSIRTQAAF